LEIGYLPDEQLVKFIVSVKANQWFSIGYAPTMYNTDMVLWQAKGAYSSVTDLWSTGHVKPTTDTQ